MEHSKYPGLHDKHVQRIGHRSLSSNYSATQEQSIPHNDDITEMERLISNLQYTVRHLQEENRSLEQENARYKAAISEVYEWIDASVRKPPSDTDLIITTYDCKIKSVHTSEDGKQYQICEIGEGGTKWGIESTSDIAYWKEIKLPDKMRWNNHLYVLMVYNANGEFMPQLTAQQEMFLSENDATNRAHELEDEFPGYTVLTSDYEVQNYLNHPIRKAIDDVKNQKGNEEAE